MTNWRRTRGRPVWGILALAVILGLSGTVSASADPTDDPGATPTTRAIPTTSKAPTSKKLVAAAARAASTATDLTALSATDLAELLVGSNATVSNVTYTGKKEAAGVYTGVDAGIENGIALTSGSLENKDGHPSSILGPFALTYGTNWLAAGDPALTAVLGVGQTYDASVLEFDFVPDRDEATFSYVFGSNEYVEDDPYDDGAAFWVNGKNYAVVPGSTPANQPVSVYRINATTNAALFVDNATGSRDTALSGFTTVMTFTAPLVKGQVNHLRIAVTDTDDRIIDSAILLAPAEFPNEAPVAHNVSGVSVQSGKSVAIPLKGTDPDGDALTYHLDQAPATTAGKVTIDPDTGVAIFTAASGFTGTATFTYIVSDGLADSDPATVTIRVVAAPASPSASPSTPTASASTLADTGSHGGDAAPLGAGLALAGIALTAGVGLRRRR